MSSKVSKIWAALSGATKHRFFGFAVFANSSSCAGKSRLSCGRARQRAEQTVAAISVMVTAAISPISDCGAIDLHRLQIGRAADDLAV